MPTKTNRRAPVAAAAALLLTAATHPLAAQSSDAEWLDRCRDGRESYSDRRRERFCEVRVERVRPGGRFTVDGEQNGSVAVRGAGAGEAVVHARITTEGRTAGDAQAIARALRIVADRDEVRADGPERSDDRQWSVSYVVEAPRRTDLHVTTHNGSISVADLAGEIDVSAHNGSVTLEGLGGDVRARTHNGSLNVRLGGGRWDGDGLDAETHNGAVRIDVPDGYDARLETGTVNGHFSSELPLTLQGKIGRTISTQIGSGGPTIHAATTNGSVTIRRAR